MAIRGTGVTISFVAWDVTNGTGKTGDVANFTLRWIKDGTASAPTNSASEVDATNVPGIYKITLTDSEATCDVGTLGGKSSTSGVKIIPLTISFEDGTKLADTLLKRDMSAVSGESARSPLNALRFLRNKWSISSTTLTVTKEDDSTSAWTATVTPTTGADPITGVDPA